jgi:hypothetical protein
LQFSQQASSGRPNAADRNLHAPTDFAVGDRRIRNKQKQQLPLIFPQFSQPLPDDTTLFSSQEFIVDRKLALAICRARSRAD